MSKNKNNLENIESSNESKVIGGIGESIPIPIPKSQNDYIPSSNWNTFSSGNHRFIYPRQNEVAEDQEPFPDTVPNPVPNNNHTGNTDDTDLFTME